MNTKRLVIAGIMVALSTGAAWADRYVSVNGLHQNGYSNWVDAATNIQAAVSVAQDGQTIWLSNGTFAVTDEISVATAITIKGAFGREATLLTGDYPARTNRCFTINNASAWLDSLTISNFTVNGNGGGVDCQQGNMTNCQVTHNSTLPSGSGFWGGGVNLQTTWTGLVTHCQISGNTNLHQYGGGLGVSGNGIIRNCEIYGNSGGNGGAMYIITATSLMIEQCVIRDNNDGTRNSGNLTSNTVFRNCLIYNNGTGFVLGANPQSLINCTIVGHTGNGVYLTPDTEASRRVFGNCIIYSNSANVNWSGSSAQTNWFYNCAYTGSTKLATGQGNITDYPMFIDPATRNYRLPGNSPCVDAGVNQTWMDNAKDLDGGHRINELRRQVDMGAYEFIPRGTLFSVK